MFRILFIFTAVLSLTFSPVQFHGLALTHSSAYAADSDGDGVSDADDAFPNDPSEQSDMDNDGEGDHSDQDRDGDGDINSIDPDPNGTKLSII